MNKRDKFFYLFLLVSAKLSAISIAGLVVTVVLSEIIGVISTPKIIYAIFGVATVVGVISLMVCFYGVQIIKLSKEIDKRRSKESEEKDERGEENE